MVLVLCYEMKSVEARGVVEVISLISNKYTYDR